MATCGSLIPADTTKWIIPKFLERMESNGQRVCSPHFAVSDTKNKIINCALVVYPRGINDSYKDFISLGIANFSETVLILDHLLSVKDMNGNTINQYHIKSKEIEPGFAEISGKFLYRNHLKEELKKSNGNLIITVEFNKTGPQSAESKLSKDFQLSFGDDQFSDIKIQCKDKIFQCHRYVLASRSPVMKVMCTGEFEEGATGIIKLDSQDPEIVQEMLLFIYSGKLKNLNAHAFELLKISDIYQLDNLKEICAYNLCGSLDLSNCLDYLLLGEMYRSEHLRETSMKFLVKNIMTVMKTDKWVEMEKKHPSLGFEVMKAAVTKTVT